MLLFLKESNYESGIVNQVHFKYDLNNIKCSFSATAPIYKILIQNNDGYKTTEQVTVNIMSNFLYSISRAFNL